MLCKFHWIVLYTVHFTAFSLGGPFFSGHGVDRKAMESQKIYQTASAKPSDLCGTCRVGVLGTIPSSPNS